MRLLDRKLASESVSGLAERYSGVIAAAISKTVAREVASVKRGQIVKGDAGIATKKKDFVFDSPFARPIL